MKVPTKLRAASLQILGTALRGGGRALTAAARIQTRCGVALHWWGLSLKTPVQPK
jgi:hypothetical protein